MPDFAAETLLLKKGGGLVCGIDEAGRGPWAGPVVAAAVILDPARIPKGIDDSKALKESARERLFDELTDCAIIGIGIADVERIDRDNILEANHWAMGEALNALSERPAWALVDGNLEPKLSCSVKTIVGGDALSLSIAAASIIAKVTRDRIMIAMDRDFPAYGFARHKGYGTAAHQAALKQHGPCIHHRRSFAPIRMLLEG
jgi:ribonuclease HII